MRVAKLGTINYILTSDFKLHKLKCQDTESMNVYKYTEMTRALEDELIKKLKGIVVLHIEKRCFLYKQDGEIYRFLFES